MKKILLIVDPQYDFINGSLKVEGAKNKMNNLAKYIKNNYADYHMIILTADSHPISHCSFKENGGEWPMHCVSNTLGAALYDSIMQQIFENKVTYKVYTKGMNSNKEEYTFTDYYFNKYNFNNIMKGQKIDQIDVTGIVGTVCVKNTIEGLIQMGYKNDINVLVDYVANFDNNDTEFVEWLNNNNIKH